MAKATVYPTSSVTIVIIGEELELGRGITHHAFSARAERRKLEKLSEMFDAGKLRVEIEECCPLKRLRRPKSGWRRGTPAVQSCWGMLSPSERKERRIEDREVLSRTGEVVNEERLRQLEVNLARGRGDRRGLPVIMLQPGCRAVGRSLA